MYTLKHFERTGQISLHRLVAISSALEVSTEVERLFKPRHRVDMNNWSLEPQTTRKRGRRRKSQIQTADITNSSVVQMETISSASLLEEPALEEAVEG